MMVVVMNPVVNHHLVQDQDLVKKIKVVAVVVIVQIQKVDHDLQVNLLKPMVVKTKNHHKINPDHVKIQLLVVNHKINHDLHVKVHLVVNHDHQVKILNPMVKKLIKHHKKNHDHPVKVKKLADVNHVHQVKINRVHQVKINLVVVKKIHQVQINLVDQHLVHQVNHHVNHKILKLKMNNHNKVEKVVKNDQMKIMIMNNKDPSLPKRNPEIVKNNIFI
jgi:hypothetical protein